MFLDAQPPSGKYNFRLYVADNTPQSATALRNLKDLCEEHLSGRYHIEVIDLLKNPKLAQRDQIVAVPTLVRDLPVPIRKFIGNLSNPERVLVDFDIHPPEASAFAAREGRRMAADRAAFPFGESENEEYVLRLYVAGNTPQSSRAIMNLKAICETHLKGRYTLTVVDLYRQPERAREDQILVAPTLIRQSPLPRRRLVGDMSNTARVLTALDLPAALPQP